MVLAISLERGPVSKGGKSFEAVKTSLKYILLDKFLKES